MKSIQTWPNDFTIEMWVNHLSDTGDHNYLFATGAWESCPGLWTKTSPSDTRFSLGTFMNGSTSMTSQIKKGAWQHVALVRHQGQSLAFIDGVSAGSINNGPPAASCSSLPMRIGMQSIQAQYYANTRYDALRISSKALYTANFTPPAALDKNADTMVLWQFNEGSGTTVVDASGNGYDLTLSGTGATWKNDCPPAITKPKFAMRSTATSSRISVTNTGFGVGGGAWTFEFWIRIHGQYATSAMDQTSGSLFDMNESYTAHAIKPKLLDMRRILASTYNNTSGPHNMSLFSSSLGTDWHHFAMVYDGSGTGWAYLDGVLTGTQTGMGPNIQANSPMAIGKPSGSPYTSYNTAPVDLGGIRYSSSARYPGVPSFTPKNDWAIDAQTIAQYLTQQGLGATLVDEAGGNNTGTVHSGWVSQTP